MGRDLIELKQQQQLSREEAAAQLRAIADELASGNDVVFEGGNGMRIVGKVPDDVRLKLEFEVGEDETEFEIELTWATRGASPAASSS